MNWREELTGRLGYVLDLPDDSPVFDPARKHDFVFLFDAKNCNPNGDPDNDNTPRQDFDTGRGIVTDVCLKRKIRDFMARTFGTERENSTECFNLYVKHKGLLGREHKQTAGKLDKRADEDMVDASQRKMRERYWDVRMFGAVLNVGKESGEPSEPMREETQQPGPEDTPAPRIKKDGKVKPDFLLKGGQCVGPMQIGFAESVEEIAPQILGIVRDALVNPRDVSIGHKDDVWAASGMPGSKPTMPYGLYECRGHYSPCLDKDGLVTPLDLAVFWNALQQMFANDYSSARPDGMSSHAAWVFTHEHKLGNYPAHRLFEHVSVERIPDALHPEQPARSYRHYEVVMRPPDPQVIKGVVLTPLFNDWG